MKTWLGLLLIVGTLMVGCASGDYARRPAYEESPATFRETRGFYQNPETSSEAGNRIWHEESGR